MSADLFASKSATFSDCRRYRYDLWRRWDDSKPFAMFIGLNPSTADENLDDPTIRRCIGFARAWGYGALCMTNLFAFRATDPADMKAHDEERRVCDANLLQIATHAAKAGVVVAAWGVHGVHCNRDRTVRYLCRKTVGIELQCLGLSKDGHPRHPLYLKADCVPVPLKPRNPSAAVTR